MSARRPILDRPGQELGTINANDYVADEIDDDVDLVRALFAEFLGSFFLVFVVLGAVYGSSLITNDTVTNDRSLYIALTYGACYAACMYAFSFPAADRRQIPNLRHLNPAVTFGLVISFKIHIGRAILYWMAQFCGAGVGVLSIYLFTPFEKKDVTTAYPLSEEANFAHSWVMETLVSWFSILAILMTCFGHLQKQPSAAHSIREASPLTNHEVNCLIAASIIIGGNLAASSTSGGFMNPLFSTGIGILSGTYELAPFFAPFIGAVGALITGLIFGFKVKVMYFKDN